MNTHHDILVRRLKEHSQALGLPLGRRVGQPGHDVARDYLLKKMRQWNLVPFTGESFEIPYEMPHPNGKQPQKFTNLIGVIPGKDRMLPPILLGAHYDSVIDAPCVDDNATSVALTLVLAQTYSRQPLERDLIIAFFDAEEPPFFLGEAMGSRRFCEDYCADIRFAAVIISDLIGHDFRAADMYLPDKVDKLVPRIRKLVFLAGSESHPAFPDIVEKVAKKSRGIRIVPVLHRYVGDVSDHAAFAEQGQPFLFLSCGMGEHYHEPEDTMEWINFRKLARITRYTADVIEEIDRTLAVEVDPSPDSFETFDFEMRMLRKAAGPLMPVALKALNIPMPESRDEMDQLVEKVMRGKLIATEKE